MGANKISSSVTLNKNPIVFQNNAVNLFNNQQTTYSLFIDSLLKSYSLVNNEFTRTDSFVNLNKKSQPLADFSAESKDLMLAYKDTDVLTTNNLENIADYTKTLGNVKSEISFYKISTDYTHNYNNTELNFTKNKFNKFNLINTPQLNYIDKFFIKDLYLLSLLLNK